jgi:AraC-like DNA-binding protein
MKPEVVYILLLFLGAFQGTSMAIALWLTPSTQRKANRWLAVLLLFFSYRLIVELLASWGYGGVDSWMYHVLLEYNWIYGVLLYGFFSAYLDPEFKLGRPGLIHFLPVIIEFLFSNFIKIQNFFWDGTAESIHWTGFYGYILWMHTPFQLVVFSALILFYSWLSQQKLDRLKGEEQYVFDPGSLLWMSRILLVYRLFAVLCILAGLIDYLFFDYAFNPSYRLPIYGGMALLTYWLGLEGYARRHRPAGEKKKVPDKRSSVQFEEVLKKLDRLMEEEWYAQPEVSVRQTAEKLEVKAYQITQALNRARKVSFVDYINRLRVEKAIRLMQDSAYNHYSILGIGLESGFNSKTSFNRAFKKFKGQSPGEFRKNIG